jgi:hypothetical protein
VERFDATSTRRDGARLIVKARAARTGVQEYDHGPETRDASEVFSRASMATWVGVPVIVQHREISTTQDAARFAVGYVSAVEREDVGSVSYVLATLVIVDTSTIANIEAGKLGGLSAGYQAELVNGRQTDIAINHLALGPPTGWARCGDACAIP